MPVPRAGVRGRAPRVVGGRHVWENGWARSSVCPGMAFVCRAEHPGRAAVGAVSTPIAARPWTPPGDAALGERGLPRLFPDVFEAGREKILLL